MMTAGRRMKHEMTVAARKRRRSQSPTLEERMEEQGLSEADRAEMRKFAAYLADSKLPLIDRIDKHGADYLGFSLDEITIIRASTEGTKP